MYRFFDIIFSGFALLILTPLLIPVVLVLKFTGEGEIFFGQDRVGLNGKTFKLYKFATMLKDSPNIGSGTVTIFDDPRVLPVGKILRKTKINELPQLINIFIGDMSIIGPRPQTKRCFDAFPANLQDEIIKVRPGLSGIGSIVFRNEEEIMQAEIETDKFYDQIIMPYKGLLEYWFVRNNSLKIYFILILYTLIVVLINNNFSIFKSFPSLPRPPLALDKFIKSDIYE